MIKLIKIIKITKKKLNYKKKILKIYINNINTCLMIINIIFIGSNNFIRINNNFHLNSQVLIN